MWHWWNSILSGELHIHPNSSVPFLVEQILKNREGHLVTGGGIVKASHGHGQTECEDFYVVKDEKTADLINWSSEVKELSDETFEDLKTEFLARIHIIKPPVYIREGSLGGREDCALKVNLITTSPAFSLLGHNLMWKRGKINTLGEVTIFHDPNFQIDEYKAGTRSQKVMAINLSTKEIIIAGAPFLNEFRQTLSAFMSLMLTKHKILSLKGDYRASTSGGVFIISQKSSFEFGLGEMGLFPFYRGDFLNVRDINFKKNHYLIEDKNHLGTLFENVSFDSQARVLLPEDKISREKGVFSSFMGDKDACNQNKNPLVPSSIIISLKDDFEALPLLSLLNKEQALYYYLLGLSLNDFYNSESFFPAHPCLYGDILENILSSFSIKVWLLNQGRGESFLDSIVDLIESRSFNDQDFQKDEVLGLLYPKHLKGIRNDLLPPKKLNVDVDASHKSARALQKKLDDHYLHLLKR